MNRVLIFFGSLVTFNSSILWRCPEMKRNAICPTATRVPGRWHVGLEASGVHSGIFCGAGHCSAIFIDHSPKILAFSGVWPAYFPSIPSPLRQPLSRFNPYATREHSIFEDDLADVQGKVVLVTGGKIQHGNTIFGLHMKEFQKRLNTIRSRHKLVSAPWCQGATTVAFAAAGKGVTGYSEKYQTAYLVPIAVIVAPSSFADDETLQKELYDTTEKIIAELL
ncbi:hypothetical protein DFH07DRAFT_767146 [Mycena maculata]|uniref:Uncharacterized protein n=1 Tax=Mycena maculata TaxID=230809 RepID=A0AAD7K0P5_9AGAR|nr:hypothetical protein DFH07DRAFT_767146 [Mycena maculata]